MPDKVLQAINDGTKVIVGKYSSSAYDYEKDVIHIAKGATMEEIAHEIGHLIDNKLISKEKRDKLLLEAIRDITVDDIQTDIYVDASGREYKNIIIIHSEKFVSDYQGRIYVDNILEVYDENNNIRIDRMLEFVSEMFREYWINKEKVKEQYPEYYLLIEESIK